MMTPRAPPKEGLGGIIGLEQRYSVFSPGEELVR